MNLYKTVGGAPHPEQFLQAGTPLHSQARAQRIIHNGPHIQTHLFRMKFQADFLRAMSGNFKGRMHE